MDESAKRLLNVFLDELEERVDALDRDLLKLEANPAEEERRELVTNLLREAHSLKGAAASVGAAEIEGASHRLEDLLTDLRDTGLILDTSRIDVLFNAADALRASGQKLRFGAPAVETATSLLPQPSAVAGPVPRRDGTVRVAVEKLDRLFEQSGELLVAHHRANERQAQIQAIREIARTPSVQAPRDIERALERLSDAVASDNSAIERVARRVNAEIRNIRMLPFAFAIDGLDRVIRDGANASGKRVRLDVRGRDIEVDRSVLDGLRDPLVHLVRNAMDHGIEASDRRIAAGKPAEGAIVIAAVLRNGGLEVTVVDDGAGLDLRAIHRQAVELGYAIEDRDVAGAVFLPGVSTARAVTSLSGRGVGLDAVRSAVDVLRGTIAVSSSEGKGTQFTLTLPLTLITLRAILFQVAGQTFALDARVVERVARVELQNVVVIEGRPHLVGADESVPLVPFRAVLGSSDRADNDGLIFPVIVVRARDFRIALRVDALLDEHDILVRNLGPRLAAARAVTGATILADGSIALIVRTSFVLERGVDLARTLQASAPLPATTRIKRILLVDDSMTTRTLERSILEAAGYEVLVAPDGEEAWRILNASECDLVVSDVDMPRMDGFALVESIRSSSTFRDIPVILVTGRESDADKRRGIDAGADAYIVKSGFDQKALLDTIADLL